MIFHFYVFYLCDNARYLKAAKWQMIVRGKPLSQYIEETICWRENHGIFADDSKAFQARSKLFHLVQGSDRGSFPEYDSQPVVTIDLSHLRYAFHRQQSVTSKNNDTGTQNIPDGLLYEVVHIMEQSIGQMEAGGADTICFIANCSGMTYSDLPSINEALEVIKVLQSHYPKRLGRMVLVDAPMAVQWLWGAIAAAVNVNAKKKIEFRKSTEMLSDQ